MNVISLMPPCSENEKTSWLPSAASALSAATSGERRTPRSNANSAAAARPADSARNGW